MEKGNKKVFKGGKEEESVFASTFDKLRLKREADESERAAIQTKAEIETAERLVMESEVTESDDAKAARVRSKLDRARLQKITIMELMRIEEEEWLEEERKRIEKEKLMAKHRAKIDVKDRVIAFYREHNPAKLSDIDNILNKYKGKELELLEKLHIQYNVPMDEALRSKPATPEVNLFFGGDPSVIIDLLLLETAAGPHLQVLLHS